jgi:hypothetical protein
MFPSGQQNAITYAGSFTANATGTCIVTANSFLFDLVNGAGDPELAFVINTGSGPECGSSPPCSTNPLTTEAVCSYPAVQAAATTCVDTASFSVTAGQNVQVGCLLLTDSGFGGGGQQCVVNWTCTSD